MFAAGWSGPRVNAARRPWPASEFGTKLEVIPGVGHMRRDPKTVGGANLVATRAGLALILALVVAGCSLQRQTVCKLGSAAAGAIVGGTAGGVGVHEGVDNASDDEVAGAAVGGALVGGIVGLVIGSYACPEPEVPPPPPVAAPPPPPAHGTKIAEIRGPNFDFSKAKLTPAGRKIVADAAGVLKANPTLHVDVNGYTDSVGSDAYNRRLSERRASTVADALVEEGIDRSRLHVKGFGEADPVADNKTAEGRARNRRVEIVAQ
jgi:OOP family OmpA-OmpF porin